MEHVIGIEVFATSSPGVGGIIKQYPDDFVVEEIPIYPPPGRGKHVIARVTATNWETNHLIERLAAHLQIPTEFIKYAGIKDKRAVTTQLISFPVDIERLHDLSLSDVCIEPLYASVKPIYPGGLVGNRFHIIVRDVAGTQKEVDAVMTELASLGHIPNFFGVQRFGAVRPITHIVGRYLIKNEIRLAVMAYIANPLEEEREETYIAREFLEKTNDFAEALEYYPQWLAYERRMIRYLAVHPEQWKDTLFQLPKNLIRMFVHAYQSYLFNRILSQRIINNMGFAQAYEGDIITPFDKDMQLQEKQSIMVMTDNLMKVNRHIQNYRCAPTAAIIGHTTPWANGKMGEIEHRVCKEENMREEEFRMYHMPDFASSGMRRITAAPLRHMNWEFDGKNLEVEFFLPKGCYATTVLREIMKVDISCY